MTPADAELGLLLQLLVSERGARAASDCLMHAETNMPGIDRLRRAYAAHAPSRCSDREFVRRLTETIEARSASQPYLADWKSNGFGAPPFAQLARGSPRLFRVWGAEKTAPGKFQGSREIGRWFSLQKPTNALEAELMSNVVSPSFLARDSKAPPPPAAGASWKLGKHDFAGDEDSAAIAPVENLIRYVSEFAVADNTIMWIGPIGHGPDDLSIPADQAFIPFLTAWSVRPVGPARRIEGFDRVVGSSGRSKFAH